MKDKTTLMNNIIKHFEKKVSEDEYIIIKNKSLSLTGDESLLDAFIYFYNAKQKYIRLTATFNHKTQLERFSILNDYIETGNFYRFRVAMNKILKDSYYMGHPKTIINNNWWVKMKDKELTKILINNICEEVNWLGYSKAYPARVTKYKVIVEVEGIRDPKDYTVRCKEAMGYIHFTERHEIECRRIDIDQYITELGLFSVGDSYDINEGNYDDYLTLFDMTFMLPLDNWMRAIYVAHLKTLVEVNSWILQEYHLEKIT